jgi:glycosyltransferase involved in cell wall biosynthesis
VRVTFVMPEVTLSGGTRVVAGYAERLALRGHQVVVVSQPRREPPWRRKLRSLLSGRGWPRAPERGPSHLDGCSAVEHRVLPRPRPVTAADLPDADVVVATWWETAEWVLPLPPRKGAKAYFLQHHEVWEGQPRARVEATWRFPMHKIVIARWLEELARQRYGDEQVSLVPNSVDLQQFNAPPRSKQAPPAVGLMYAPLRWKGTDLALEAFRLAARRISGLRLVAFGHSPPVPELPLPAEAVYNPRPPQDRLRLLYAGCDAWLFGSRSEGFGLPLLEAMACGTPVVATPAGAAPELLAAGGGLLVPPEDPAAMAAAIERIIALDAEAWQAMSRQARAIASAYTWEQATQGFEAALARAMARC